MTSKLTMMELTSSAELSSRTSNRIVFAFLLAMLGVLAIGSPLSAQTPSATSYSCFPTCSSTDGRFLTVAGNGYHTLNNTEIVLKVGSAGVATSFEVGFFDGETGGLWDQGSMKIKYYLYADPTGTGVGTKKVAEFKAENMADNVWTPFVVTNVEAARAPNGNYLYILVATTKVDTTQIGGVIASVNNIIDDGVSGITGNDDEDGVGSYWSSFKVRSTGTLALTPQAFTVCATANTDLDLNVIYPAGLSRLDSTTYDGSWKFFLDVPSAATSFSVWDGDMDFGSYDCSVNDVDDLNTPNNVLPEWASAATTNLEGVGLGSACVGTIGYSTGAPPDDNRYPMYRRSPAVYYEIVTPSNEVFTNSNPSGSKEWEEFKLTTATLDRNLADAHIDSIPAGIYELRVKGMDLSNLNAWRFSSDAVGVDIDGHPTEPIRAYSIEGTVGFQATTTAATTTGTTATTTRKGRKGTTTTVDTTSSTTVEKMIPNVLLTLRGDRNGDNVIDVTLTTMTGDDGWYTFDNVGTGRYSVTVTTTTLPTGSVCVSDLDGIATPNQITLNITPGGANPKDVDFRYNEPATTTTTTGTNGTRTQGYWKTHASAWSCTSIMIGCTTYTREKAIKIMDHSTTGDMTYTMYQQLVAAKLNVAAGARSSCILLTITEAENWLCRYHLGSNVSASSRAWTNSGLELHTTLDEYNNGRLCAPHVR